MTASEARMSGWEDCTIENRAFRQYRDPGGEGAEPFGVTAIGERAFVERGDVTRVALPDGLKK